MIIPVRCFTCGKVIADKYDYFVQKCNEREKAAASSTATEAKYKHFDTVTKGDILNDIGLTRYCCRRHMLGQVDMMDTI
jgi:DNA-directed RNA polymerase subunit N (RpoN/RPB10)